MKEKHKETKIKIEKCRFFFRLEPGLSVFPFLSLMAQEPPRGLPSTVQALLTSLGARHLGAALDLSPLPLPDLAIPGPVGNPS